MNIVRSEITMGFPYTHSTGPIVGATLGALRAGHILGAQCGSCESVNVPAREWCERCGGSCDVLVPVGPLGTVDLVAESGGVHWARVRLDGADTDLLHIVAQGVVEGERIAPRWRAERIGAITDIEYFEPMASGTSPAEPGGTADTPEERIETFERNVSLPYTLSAGALLSRFFNDIRERGVIHGVACTNCRNVIVPPSVECARCWTDTEGWLELPDRGIVTTFVVVNVPFHGQQMPLPYVLARILLDGADTSFLHVLGEVAHTDVRMGMRVEAVWRAQRGGFLNDDVEFFRPTGEPDVSPSEFLDRL